MGKLLDSTTDAEKELLAMVLRNVRHAAAEGCQLSIIFDPFVTPGCDGAHVFFGYDYSGRSCQIDGKFRRRRMARRKR